MMNEPVSSGRVLIVAGSDSSGGAGIQADLKTVSVLGAYGMTAITALTAQNTTGVYGVSVVEPEFVAAQIDACVSDIGCDALKTGMLANAAIIRIVAAKIREHSLTNVVLDPVMVAKSGDRLLEEDAVEALRSELLPLATVVTPNLPEASALTGLEVGGQDQMVEAAELLVKMGTRAVVVKGGHLSGSAADIFFDGERLERFEAERVQTPHTHGTGCCFASAIAAGLAQGMELRASVARAKRFISAAIRAGLPIGSGHGPANPLAWLKHEKGAGSREQGAGSGEQGARGRERGAGSRERGAT